MTEIPKSTLPSDIAGPVTSFELKGMDMSRVPGTEQPISGALVEQAGVPEAEKLAGALDAGSMALEHVATLPFTSVAPSKLRSARRHLAESFRNRLATGLVTMEAAQLSPGNLIDNVIDATKLVTTDPYKQAASNNARLARQLPQSKITHI